MPFTYSEIVVGSLTNQNNVYNLAVTTPPEHGVDCFRSVFLASDELVDFVEKTGAVHGYRGKVTIDWVPIIFSARELDRALADARIFTTMLDLLYDIPPTILRICYSGSLGFHILLPSDLFGTIEPSEYLPEVMKGIVFALTTGFDTVDLSVYHHSALIRLNNTQDSTTRLFKVLLTYPELIQLSTAEIKKLAGSPRSPNSMIPKTDVLPNLDLMKMYAEFHKYIATKAKK